MEVGHIGTSRSVLFEHRFEPQANAQTLMLKVKVEWEIKNGSIWSFSKGYRAIETYNFINS